MFHRKHRELPAEHREAALAIKEAESHLYEVKARAYDVHKTAAETRTLRERNHFADQLTAMMSQKQRRRA